MNIRKVRELAVKTLSEMGFDEAEPTSESMLIMDGYYVGCRFRYDSISVLWLEESGQLRFIDDEAGKLLKIMRLDASSESACGKRAA